MNLQETPLTFWQGDYDIETKDENLSSIVNKERQPKEKMG